MFTVKIFYREIGSTFIYCKVYLNLTDSVFNAIISDWINLLKLNKISYLQITKAGEIVFEEIK